MIITQTQQHVSTLFLDRASRRNALDRRGIKMLVEAIATAEADAGCRVIVIRGRNGTFCSGRDLADADAHAPLDAILAYDEDWTDVIHLLTGLSKPSVAVVEGYAVAGGFTLAMACDFMIADTSARFGALEMRGGFPAAVNCAVLARVAGPRKALEFLLSAETFSAEHLERAGLINHLANGPAELDRIALDVTGRLAALDPIAVKLTKDAHRMASVMPISEAIVMGRQLNSLLMASGRITAARDQPQRRDGPKD